MGGDPGGGGVEGEGDDGVGGGEGEWRGGGGGGSGGKGDEGYVISGRGDGGSSPARNESSAALLDISIAWRIAFDKGVVVDITS